MDKEAPAPSAVIPEEEPSIFSSWDVFSASVTASINELTQALAETGNSISISLNQAWEEFEWPDEYTPNMKQKQKQLALLDGAAVGWEQKVKEVWNAALGEHPINIDIPRLISKIRVENANGEVLFSANSEQTNEEQVISFFLFLAQTLKDQIFQEMIDHLESLMRDKPAFTNAIKQMLEVPNAPSSPSVKLLKGAHQKMLFPAYYSIKSQLKSPQMKDKAGAWQIVILLDQNRAELRHKKTQIVLEWMVSDTAATVSDLVVIEADWDLILEFDAATMELQDVSTQVLDGFYNDKVVSPALAEHFAKNTPLKPQKVNKA